MHLKQSTYSEMSRSTFLGGGGLSGGCAIIITTGKKNFQSSVWRVRDRYYDRKIKKFQLSVWRVGNRYYDRKKKVLVVYSFLRLSVSLSVCKG
jgi:hypothetical protein